MRAPRVLLFRLIFGAAMLGAVCGFGGCQATASREEPTALQPHLPPAPQRPVNAPGTADNPAAPPTPAAEAVRLAAVKVHEWPLSDFGLSVKTNFEVAQGENVRWMEVSGMEPGGPAARIGLDVGDRILAIDGTLVTTLTRDGLLDALFKRKAGDHVRLLVARRNEALPRFVQLIARRT